MTIFRSRALTDSLEPRPMVRGIAEVIEEQCTDCEISYEFRRTHGPLSPGHFFLLQGHLEMMCVEGHKQLIRTQLRHQS